MSTTATTGSRVIWRPQPGPQTEFHRRAEFEVLYGGSRGGGKTDSLIVEALRYVDRPEYTAIFFRRTYPQLRQVIRRARRLIPQVAPGAEWRAGEHTWIFPSGATLTFAHLQHEDSTEHYQGHEYQYVAMDELTHYTEQMYLDILATCRSTVPGLTPRMRGSANPGGIGHAWVKRRFVDRCTPVPDGPRRYEALFGVDWQPMRPGPTYTDPDTGLTRAFVPSRVFDNRILVENDPQYVRVLLALPEHRRRAWLEGDWDVFAGQYFDTWDPSVHVVDHFDPPADWPRFRAMDWGYARPYSIGWYARTPSGALYRYRELYGTTGEPDVGSRETAEEVARRVVAIEEAAGEKPPGQPSPITGPADPSIWAKGGQSELSIAETFSSFGIDFIPGNNDRVSGWNQCRQRLGTDDQGHRMFVVSRMCRHFIRTIPTLVHSETRPEDLDDSGEDHAADEWRYMCMYWTMGGSGVYLPELDEDTSLHPVLTTTAGEPIILPEDDDAGEWWD